MIEEVFNFKGLLKNISTLGLMSYLKALSNYGNHTGRLFF